MKDQEADCATRCAARNYFEKEFTRRTPNGGAIRREDSGRAWRFQERCLGPEPGALGFRNEVPEGPRRKQSARSSNEVKIQFAFELLQVAFLFGGLARLDELAELARVLSVKSFLQRDADRFALGKTYGHADPGGRLQQGPMPADDNHQREHDQQPAAAEEHARMLWLKILACQRVEFDCAPVPAARTLRAHDYREDFRNRGANSRYDGLRGCHRVDGTGEHDLSFAQRGSDALRRFSSRGREMEFLVRDRRDERRLDAWFAALVLDGLLRRKTVRAEGGEISPAEATRPRTDGTVLPSPRWHRDRFHRPLRAGDSPFHFHPGWHRANATAALLCGDVHRGDDMEHLPARTWNATAQPLEHRAEVFAPDRHCHRCAAGAGGRVVVLVAPKNGWRSQPIICSPYAAEPPR